MRIWIDCPPRSLRQYALCWRAWWIRSVRAIAGALIDDEPFTEEDRAAVAEADEWRKHNQPIPLEEVLADFGLKLNDWERMGKMPASEKHG